MWWLWNKWGWFNWWNPSTRVLVLIGLIISTILVIAILLMEGSK